MHTVIGARPGSAGWPVSWGDDGCGVGELGTGSSCEVNLACLDGRFGIMLGQLVLGAFGRTTWVADRKQQLRRTSVD